MFPYWHAANKEDFGDIRKCIIILLARNVNFVQIFSPNTPPCICAFLMFLENT